MRTPDPISLSLSIRNLGPRGFEVVVSIVNEGEDWLVIKSAQVQITKDHESFGEHRLSFTSADHEGSVKLGQFSITEGHFHLNQDVDHRHFEFQVEVSYSYGDAVGTAYVTQQVETQKITKKT